MWNCRLTQTSRIYFVENVAIRMHQDVLTEKFNQNCGRFNIFSIKLNIPFVNRIYFIYYLCSGVYLQGKCLPSLQSPLFSIASPLGRHQFRPVYRLWVTYTTCFITSYGTRCIVKIRAMNEGWWKWRKSSRDAVL